MPEPKTLPAGLDPNLQKPPSEAHYAWLGRAEGLLSAFERGLPPPAPGEDALSLGFILMIADQLWDTQREQADFARLDVHSFALGCHAVLCRDGVAAACTRTLSAFYAWLVQVGEVDAGSAQAISAQLLALEHELARRT